MSTQRKVQAACLRRCIDLLEKSSYSILNATSLKELLSVHSSTFYRLKYLGIMVESPSPSKVKSYDIKKTIVAMKVELARMKAPREVESLPENNRPLSKSEFVDKISGNENLYPWVSAIGSNAGVIRLPASGNTEMERFEQAKLKAAKAAREAYRDSMLESADAAKASGDNILEIMLLRTYALKDEELSQL